MASYNAAHHQEKAAYYAANRDAQLAYSATYRDAHRRDIAAYKAGRREESAAHSRSRRSREHGNGGAHTAADIRAQHERQRGRCYYCEVEVGETYHVDHVVPITKGGSNDPSNLVIACPRCNLSKRDKLPHEFAGRLC